MIMIMIIIIMIMIMIMIMIIIIIIIISSWMILRFIFHWQRTQQKIIKIINGRVNDGYITDSTLYPLLISSDARAQSFYLPP